mgnify:FL=1|tara:strand:+ start:543 stop:782 length:240 start_codon:yes stop_codon:yes gene_type:complete
MSNINKTIYDAIKPHVKNDKLTKEDALETIANSTSEIQIEKLEMQLEWFNSFVDAIQAWDLKLYNRACKYADEVEEGSI